MIWLAPRYTRCKLFDFCNTTDNLLSFQGGRNLTVERIAHGARPGIGSAEEEDGRAVINSRRQVRIIAKTDNVAREANQNQGRATGCVAQGLR